MAQGKYSKNLSIILTQQSLIDSGAFVKTKKEWKYKTKLCFPLLLPFYLLFFFPSLGGGGLPRGQISEAEGWAVAAEPGADQRRRWGQGWRGLEWLGNWLHTGGLSKGVNILRIMGNRFLTVGESI